MGEPQRIQTLVIGGGQAGLSVGYHLARRGIPVRDPRGASASRRQLAAAVGFASPVYSGALRRPRGDAVPGFHPGCSWIDLPILGDGGRPMQERGAVVNEPGLYFVGLVFLYAASSVMIHGVGRDAEHIADTIAARTRDRRAA